MKSLVVLRQIKAEINEKTKTTANTRDQLSKHKGRDSFATMCIISLIFLTRSEKSNANSTPRTNQTNVAVNAKCREDKKCAAVNHI